uniref:Uncharacterized protein n=1 Tax=Octopus bimaculoides TaxID=37653 RepID=A0A0L8H984_OCTBM
MIKAVNSGKLEKFQENSSALPLHTKRHLHPTNKSLSLSLSLFLSLSLPSLLNPTCDSAPIVQSFALKATVFHSLMPGRSIWSNSNRKMVLLVPMSKVRQGGSILCPSISILTCSFAAR